MLTQKADLFASEMIHLDLHERPYFWIETSLQNLVQPPDAAAWCHIVSLFTQLPAYCSASIGRRYMCGARDHLYRAGPTQGRIHPVSSTLQLQVCALVLLFQLKVLVHLLKVSSRTSTSHQDVLHSGNAFSPKVSPKGSSHEGHSGEYGNDAKSVGKMSKSVMQLISIHFWNWF